MKVAVISETAARRSGYWLIVVVLAMLAGLPLAVWLDISDLSGNTLRRQARDMSSLISSIRSYYSTNVVGRVLAAHANGTTEGTVVSHNYANIPGAIPLL